MKNMFLTGLGIGVIVPAAHAQNKAGDASLATRMQQTGSYDKH